MDFNNVDEESLNGIYNELASLLGTEDVLKIHSVYRGQQITFPVNLFNRNYIASQIVKEYNGSNVKQLATKYGYTEKWIRKIIKDHINKEK